MSKWMLIKVSIVESPMDVIHVFNSVGIQSPILVGTHANTKEKYYCRVSPNFERGYFNLYLYKRL